MDFIIPLPPFPSEKTMKIEKREEMSVLKEVYLGDRGARCR